MKRSLTKDLQRQMKELERLATQLLPGQIELELQRLIEASFEKEQYQDNKSSKWKSRIGENAQSRGERRGLLVKTGTLRNGIEIYRRANEVVISVPVEYAQIHNEGGRIRVTEKMIAFFWAMYYQNDKDEFWRNMALKKAGSVIVIPQRQFMPIPGDKPNPVLDERIQKFTDDQMDKIFLKP